VVRGGIASRPLSWEELSAAVSSGHWDGLGRLADTQQAYNAHKQQVAQEWSSMGDFILHTVFGAPRIQPLTAGGKSFVKARGGTEASDSRASEAAPCTVPITPSSAEANSGSAANNPLLSPALPFATRWTPNAFPYGVAPGISHHLLWLSQGHSIAPAMVQAEIERRFPTQEFDTLAFVNPIHNRSVKEVYHTHVFSRKKQQQQMQKDTKHSEQPSLSQQQKPRQQHEQQQQQQAA